MSTNDIRKSEVSCAGILVSHSDSRVALVKIFYQNIKKVGRAGGRPLWIFASSLRGSLENSIALVLLYCKKRSCKGNGKRIGHNLILPWIWFKFYVVLVAVMLWLSYSSQSTVVCIWYPIMIGTADSGFSRNPLTAQRILSLKWKLDYFWQQRIKPKGLLLCH